MFSVFFSFEFCVAGRSKASISNIASAWLSFLYTGVYMALYTPVYSGVYKGVYNAVYNTEVVTEPAVGFI